MPDTTTTLPEPIRTYIRSASRHTRVPPDAIAIPFLALVGGLVGNRLRVRITPAWHEYPHLWVSLIAPSGIGKSPAIRAAHNPFASLQREHAVTNQPKPLLTTVQWIEKEIAEAEKRIAEAEKLVKSGFKQGTSKRPRSSTTTTKPLTHPISTNRVATDRLAAILETAPGITIVRDELLGLVRLLNRRGGEERQRYLSLWSAEPFSISRGRQSDHWIETPVVSIVGGIQPSLLKYLHSRHQDGLLERFLPITLDAQPQPWIEHPDPPDHQAVTDHLRPLLDLPKHTTIHCTPDAKTTWIEWFDRNLETSRTASPAVRAFANKLPAHLSRFALLLHALHNPSQPDQPVTTETMHHAVALIELIRTHIQTSLTDLERKPAPPIGQSILRILTETDGWLSRNHLRIAVGSPLASDFDPEIETLLNQQRIEQRIDHPNRGRPRQLYRVVA